MNTSTESVFVNFGDIARRQLKMQCQYASRYIDGAIEGWENLGEGLRFKGFDSDGDISNYHAMEIHKDDVAEFVRRVNENRGES